MEDHELDHLLSAAGAVSPPPGAVLAAQRLAATATRRRRRRWGIAMGGAVVLLTGAGTAAAHQLGIPPFVTLPDGTERSAGFVALPSVNDRGVAVTCRTYVEFADVSDDQRQRIEAVLAATDWRAIVTDGPGTAPVGSQVLGEVRRQVPDVVQGSPAVADGVPRFTATVTSCLPG